MANLINDLVLDEKRNELARELEKNLRLISTYVKSHDPVFIAESKIMLERKYGELINRLRISGEVDPIVVAYDLLQNLPSNEKFEAIANKAREAYLDIHHHNLENHICIC